MPADRPNLALTVPPDLAERITAQADAQGRDTGELLRDAIETFLDSGTPDFDTAPRHRDRIRRAIEEGRASAQSGPLVDGEAAFARTLAHLDELERQGRT
jgi:predicted transcriptional regulator